MDYQLTPSTRSEDTKVSTLYKFVFSRITQRGEYSPSRSTYDDLYITSLPDEVAMFCEEIEEQRKHVRGYPQLKAEEISSKAPDDQGNVFCIARLGLGNGPGTSAFLTCWFNTRDETASDFKVIFPGRYCRFWQVSLYYQSVESDSMSRTEILDETGRNFLFAHVKNGSLGEEKCFGKLVPCGIISNLEASERERLGISKEEFLRYLKDVEG